MCPTFSLAATGKTCVKKKWQSNDLNYAQRAVWSHFMILFSVFYDVLKQIPAVKLKKRFVDYRTLYQHEREEIMTEISFLDELFL